ncbi:MULTISPECIES: hypothetical protein [Rhizobium]|uniref:hypothetical protein n=1 Tax=Rhizobium TaxID=379 RepID=UPI001C92A485|nr:MULTISPECIES: hypothetical protein [Rhizobium]MBY3027474.1 hypothetical protein [Rhizobium leguminosarum]MBY3179757.1 hypothetical protein [Rhizobium leguminosarum]MBY3349179.1 hypothetical protein [Rhizobium laguerreae]MBY3356256.1 hypothetical protein [Rhizobium laguerreae]MBY3370283.1 hypothetical protein [Rhizobium laguerreae]
MIIVPDMAHPGSVKATPPALVPDPVEHPLGRMALLARHIHILVEGDVTFSAT